MKISILLGGLTGAIAIGGVANAATVTLNLDGLQPRGGNLLVSVQSRDQHMKTTGVSGVMIPGNISGKTTITLPNVPLGDYAVTVLHDADGNMRMGLSPDGKPLEGWTTTNAAALRGMPVFDQVKFTVSGDTAISQTMIYPAQ